MIRAAVLALALCASAARAEFVILPGPASDDDFYRAVSCGAPPGGDCRIQHRRWPPGQSQRLTVRVVQVQPGYPEPLAAQVDSALDTAIAEINRVGPVTLRLTRDPDAPRADISVYLVDAANGEQITGTGLPFLDGTSIANAQVRVRSDGPRILRAWIVFTQSLTPETAPSVVLEELFQSLGFLFDVRGPHYAGRSILDEDGSAVKSLTGQDARLLSMKYPY